MNARLEVACLFLSVLLILNGVQRSRSIIGGDSMGPMGTRIGVVKGPTIADADSLDDAVATIVANNPFRLSNKPANARFLSTMPGVAPSAPMRPQFMLRAIIGGPPWSAIVEGIPGQTGGTVVTAGLAFDNVRIRAITRDTVVVQAPDTTWKLTLKVNP
jgi:hypothetical protein